MTDTNRQNAKKLLSTVIKKKTRFNNKFIAKFSIYANYSRDVIKKENIKLLSLLE